MHLYSYCNESEMEAHYQPHHYFMSTPTLIPSSSSIMDPSLQELMFSLRQIEQAARRQEKMLRDLHKRSSSPVVSVQELPLNMSKRTISMEEKDAEESRLEWYLHEVDRRIEDEDLDLFKCHNLDYQETETAQIESQGSASQYSQYQAYFME